MAPAIAAPAIAAAVHHGEKWFVFGSKGGFKMMGKYRQTLQQGGKKPALVTGAALSKIDTMRG